ASLEKNVERAGTLAKARADEVAERIANETARRANQQRFAEREEAGARQHACQQQRQIAFDHGAEEDRPQPVPLKQFIHALWFVVCGLWFLVDGTDGDSIVSHS